jgi:hypothetical protein
VHKRVQRFHNKMTKLKNLLARLTTTIADKDAEHLLLDTAKNSLGVVERCLLPHALKMTNDNTEMWCRLIEFHLEAAEGELRYAEGVVAKGGGDCPCWLAYTFADWRPTDRNTLHYHIRWSSASLYWQRLPPMSGDCELNLPSADAGRCLTC